ncbi:diguanylate cyclase [Kutzneria sp. CA-103260]|uniref:diguanylate cyclase n=1 Tax=Kutzneria sp. CA-103260 TaxID=2802641 RepID=UPI001BAC1401|nr:diguanylate cyclase [Kutzneria sp. CA-103260]QUQ62684.1 Diguanylate cyclase, GGDEF domain [Kutzneria sp. CA-103260]
MGARGPRTDNDRLWIGYLSAGALVLLAYYLVPPTGAGVGVRITLYCLDSASAAVMVVIGILRHHPRPRLPWFMLALSQVVYAAADTSFYVAHYAFGNVDYPGVADPLYVAHYPLVVAGLLMLIRRRTPGRDLPGILDAAVIGVGAAMLSWLFLIAPNARLDAPIVVKAFSLAYPVLDLLMLTVALRLILGGGRRPLSFYLLTFNMLAFVAADTMYVAQQLSGTYVTGNFLDAIWLAGNLGLGAAALHPTMARLTDPSPVRDASIGPARITALCAAALIAPVTLFIQANRGDFRDIPVIALACAALFGLTIARLAGLVSDQRRLAITDALTGLHTRRFFEAQLPIEVARARRGGGSLAVFIVDVDHFKSINDRYGHPAGDQALIEIAARLRGAARGGDVLARYGGEEFALLVPEASLSELQTIAERLRVRVASSPVAVSEDTWIAVTVSVGAACFPLHGDSPNELVATADRALYVAKARGRDQVVVGEASATNTAVATDHTAMIDYLSHVADEVDALLAAHDHSLAISRWALTMATALGQDEAMARNAELAGRLHDIGKIVIPEAVLTKPTALTEDEWRLVRQHPEYGYRLARMVPGFGVVADIIRQHHERYDGNGYPSRLVGNGIRVEARVLAICDSWAAMLVDRPYQPALSVDAAAEQLRQGRGTQFDPDVVDLFLDLLRQGRVGDLKKPTELAPEQRP